jgi:hypothetical protein
MLHGNSCSEDMSVRKVPTGTKKFLFGEILSTNSVEKEERT